jgi:hypothetical protein
MKNVLVDLLKVLYTGEKLRTSLEYLNYYEKCGYKINHMNQVIIFLNDIKLDRDSDQEFLKSIK